MQFGGDEVVKAKDGAGSATLSMAWAAAKFLDALLRAMAGETGIIIPTFVQSELFVDKVFTPDWLISRAATFSPQRSSCPRMELTRFMDSARLPIGRRNCSIPVSKI
jgi:hypothetical protein